MREVEFASLSIKLHRKCLSQLSIVRGIFYIARIVLSPMNLITSRPRCYNLTIECWHVQLDETLHLCV